MWRKFKKFGDKLGEAIVDGLVFWLTAIEFAARHGQLVFGLALIAGLVSPATDGYGVDWLAGSELATWGPVGALPLAVLILIFLTRLLLLLDREGNRQTGRIRRERPLPGVDRQLKLDAERRDAVNEPLREIEDLPPMEYSSFCADIMRESLGRIGARGIDDMSLVLTRYTEELGYVGVETVGRLEREVEAKLQLGHVRREDIDDILKEDLAEFQYRHESIRFRAGPHVYLLLAVSGATIPGDVLAELSEASVLMLEEYAWAARRRNRKRDQ